MTATSRAWGLLTNGQRWRLDYAGARSRIDTYYEADLHYLLSGAADEPDAAFRWFYRCFRAEAFRPVRERGYRSYSFTSIKRTVAAKIDDRNALSGVSTRCK